MSVLGVFVLRIQSECEKIPKRKTPNTDTFLAVYRMNEDSFGIRKQNQIDS